MKLFRTHIVFAIASIFVAACGGGGGAPQQEYTALATTPSAEAKSAATQVHAISIPTSSITPMLVMGTYADYDVAGYTLTTWSPKTGANIDLAEKTCVGKTSFSVNPVTGRTEVYCLNGSTFSFDSATGKLSAGPDLPKMPAWSHVVACASTGKCYYGFGAHGRHDQSSTEAIYIVDVDGKTVGSPIPFLDEKQNRAPIAMKIVRSLTGAEEIVAVTQGYALNDFGISRFDVATLTWVGTCSVKAEMVALDIGRSGVVFSLRRGVSAKAEDAMVVDAETCAVKATLRIPVEDVGIPIAKFVVMTDDAIYLGGGDDRVATPVFGVWKFSSATNEVTGFIPTDSLPLAGVYARGNAKLWVATKGNLILEVDAGAMTKTREFSKPFFGGDMFFVE